MPVILPAAGDLTDLASVRTFMQKTASDTTQDSDLQVLISQASGAVSRFCDREFAPASTGVQRVFEYQPTVMPTQPGPSYIGSTFVGSSFTGSEILNVSPYEFRNVTSVLVDTDIGAGVALTTLNYRLWRNPARDGTYFGLRLWNVPYPVRATGQTADLPFLTRQIAITGDWGMASVPGEVQHWTNVIVESWIHMRRDAGMGIGPEPGGELPGRPDDIPPAARWGLKRWMRPTPSV